MANEINDSNQWFLRIANGSVFGPVSTKGLIIWAEQGRIVPGNEVSKDRTLWLPAESVPDLEMNWYVNAGAKTEGPFNRTAAESFLKSGKAPAGARLINSRDVDPSVLVHRNDPETGTEWSKTVPEAKTPAANRLPAPKTIEPASEVDAQARRVTELESALEKQREALTLARQAAKAQTALEDERDNLRKQMLELQAQMENFRTNAEKDAQKRERKLETLKQEMNRLKQEQEAVRARPLLELLPAAETAADPEPPDAQLTAVELVSQQMCDALRQDLVHAQTQIETLRQDLSRAQAESAPLRQDLSRAQAESAPLRQDLSRTQAESAALRQDLSRTQAESAALRQSLTESQTENDTLQVHISRLELQVTELVCQIDQRENECRQLTDEREKLQSQLGLAMSAATDATNEAANGDMRRRLEQLDAINTGQRTQLAQADEALAAERAALAELLAASNTRDLTNHERIEALEQQQAKLESQLQTLGSASEREAKLAAEVAAARTRMAELQGRLARIPETTSARAPEAASWLRQFATEELSTLDKALHEERQSFNGFRSLSATRQEGIQSRIQALQRLLSGDLPDGRRSSTPSQRISGLDQSRLQNEVDSLREIQQKETKQFEERESELLRRIRLLENEESRLRSQMESSDREGGKKLELLETVRRREQELAQERRNHDQDREQFDAARQALQRRIEELERAAGIHQEPQPASTPREALPASETPLPANKPRRRATFGGWLKGNH